MFEATLAAKKIEAQKRANKTGITQYLGRTYTCRFYISVKKPTAEWFYGEFAPQVGG